MQDSSIQIATNSGLDLEEQIFIDRVLTILLSPGGLGRTWASIAGELGISTTTMWRRMNQPNIKKAIDEYMAVSRAEMDNIMLTGLPRAMRNLLALATDKDEDGAAIGVQHRDQVAAAAALGNFLRLFQENAQFEASRPRLAGGRNAALNVKVSRIGDEVHIVLGQAQLADEENIIDVTPVPAPS